MTQEEKQLLLKDLCARLPYETIVHISNPAYSASSDEKLTIWTIDNISFYGNVKPYLRPLSSMTEDELFNYNHLDLLNYSNDGFEMPNFHSIDWLLAHHFDFRNLIEEGLALEAPKDMYKTE